jgi:hypothetical protein
MALSDGWCIYFTVSFTALDQIYYILYSLPPLVGSGIIFYCMTVLTRQVKRVCQAQKQVKSRGGEKTPLIVRPHIKSDRQQMKVAVSIINNILATFLICYSGAIYIAIRHLLMVFRIADHHYVKFESDGSLVFDEVSLVIFRLKFTLTIIFSIINPLLVFRASSVFRNNIGDLFALDDFSYIVTNRF